VLVTAHPDDRGHARTVQIPLAFAPLDIQHKRYQKRSFLIHKSAENCVVSGYTRQAQAEAAISRYKRVIGNALRSRTDQSRTTEVAIAVDVLNVTAQPG
jgi:hypothetical protein